jgi:hypothetical protein
MHRSVLAAALLGAVLLVAACQAATSGSPGESVSADSSEPSVEQTATPAETPGGGNGGELDAMLPDEVGGIALEYQYASGAAAMGGQGVPPEAQAFFDRTGAGVEDISTAFGFAYDQADPENPKVITVFAMRVAGVGEGQLRDEFRTVLEGEGGANSFTEENVGGKSVLAFQSSEGADADSYLYVKGDVVFMVAGSPLELATEALSKLP